MNSNAKAHIGLLIPRDVVARDVIAWAFVEAMKLAEPVIDKVFFDTLKQIDAARNAEIMRAITKGGDPENGD